MERHWYDHCRCHFGCICLASRILMTSKFGYILSNCEISYIFNLEIYLGKIGNILEVGFTQRMVENLLQPMYLHGRNITMDNFFTSIPLAEPLFSERITMIETLKSNKPKIPIEFQNNSKREVYSNLFGYNGYLALCWHVPKKGKAVMILTISDIAKRKPHFRTK